MRISELNTMAQQLDSLGSQHLKTNAQGQISRATSSLFGRFVNWVRSRHSDAAATANRALINQIILTIQNTNGLGTEYAGFARRKLAQDLESGRPLSGRDASRVIRDIINLKTTDDTARMESRILNARTHFESLNTPGANGAPSKIEEGIAHWRAYFGLPPATPAQIQEFQTSAEGALVTSARTATKSPTLNDSQAKVYDMARMAALKEAKAGIAALANQVTGDGPEGFTTRFSAAMQAKGLTGTISQETEQALKTKIHEKLTVRCLQVQGNVHQPTLEEARDVADRVINEMVDALNTVQTSDLPAASKRTIQDVILHSSDPVTPGMAHAICESVGDTGIFLAELSRPGHTLQTLRTAFDVYAQTLHNAITLPDGRLRSGIAGGPEAATVRTLTAQSACLITGLGTLNPLTDDELNHCEELKEKQQPIPEDLAPRYAAMSSASKAMQHAIDTGSPLHVMRYAMAQEADPGVRTRESLLLMTMMETLNQATGIDIYRRTLMNPAGLGQMNMAQARQFVPQGTGLPQQDGQSLNVQNALQSMTRGFNQQLSKTPPGNGSDVLPTASPALKQKMDLFSQQFLLDFFRNGVVINGTRIGTGIGTSDSRAMETALDQLIAQFPSPEEAGRVCSPIHQVIAMEMLITLNTDPATSAATTQFIGGGSKCSDFFIPSINRHEDGSYAIHVEYSGQQDINSTVSGTSSGLNIAVDCTLPNGQEPLQFTATGFDVLFSTVQ